jgi:hypothetical protein
LKRVFFIKSDVMYDVAVSPLEIEGADPSTEAGENKIGRMNPLGRILALKMIQMI